MKERNKRVLVGMSGGIDSTATCLMLQEQGYEIVGVTMRVWGDEPQDARELAARMGCATPCLNSVYWRNGPTSWTAPTLRPDITPGWKSGTGTSIL